MVIPRLDELYPLLVAAMSALAAGVATLWVNIRQRAWLSTFEEKQKRILTFVETFDKFGTTVMSGCEIFGYREGPLPKQLSTLLFWSRQRWGPNPHDSQDPYVRYAMGLLPRKEVFEDPDRARAMLERGRMAILRTVEEEMHKLYWQLGEQQTTLILFVRNPAVPRRALEHVASVYSKVFSEENWDALDYDEFIKQWSKESSFLKLSLRADLDRSRRSLNGATGLSLAWRVRRFLRSDYRAKLTRELSLRRS